jgi:hypothetical protein
MVNTKPDKYLGGIFLLLGIVGFIMSLLLGLGIILLSLGNDPVPSIGLLVVVFFMANSTLAIGVGRSLYKYGFFSV